MERLQQFVENDHLAGIFDEVLVRGIWGTRLLVRNVRGAGGIKQRSYCAVEEIRMASDFAKLRVQIAKRKQDTR